MTDHDQAYYDALQLCGERYREMLRHNVGVGRDKQITLSQFVDSFNYHCRQGTTSIPKLCRWLGYIQGTLIEWRVTSVDVERDWTRPLFRPLDYPAASCEHSGRWTIRPRRASMSRTNPS